MINRVVLVGRLTKDPEMRYTPNGVAVGRFTLAVNRTFTNQQGERQADFINCIIWRKPAENAANFLRKGSLAGVDGRIQTGSYEGQDGKRVYTTEVVVENIQFLEPKNANANRPQQGQQSGGQQNNYGGQSYGSPQQGNFQQPSYSYTPPNQNYARVDEDPFAPANNGGKVDVTDDDLPF